MSAARQEIPALEGPEDVNDYTKCAGRLTFNQDLALHIACKALWVAVAAVAFARPPG